MAEQHGVASLRQLEALGLETSTVRSRVAAGGLVRVHAGVYALAPPRTDSARWMAAVLACGPGAILSHRSAAALWGIRPDQRPKIEVTSPPRHGRSRPGIHGHTSRILTDDDRGELDAIPVTSLARTLLDLAAVVDRRQVERAIARSETLRLFDRRAVEEVLTRTRGHRGAGRLRAALGQAIAPTRNELERAMHAICRSAGLPDPRVNEWLVLPDGTGFRPDFHWLDHRLVVETDGFEEHGTRRAFGHDRARDRRLRLTLGIETFRFTWEEVMLTPAAVASELTAFLGQAEVA